MRKKFLPIIIVAIVAVCVVIAGSQLHWWGGGPSGDGGTQPPEPPSGNETPEHPPVTPSASIFVIEGSVLVWKAGAANWTEAQVGMTLKPGDVIKSGDGSSAQITFFDGSTIDLEAGTEVEVVSLAVAQAGSTTIKLKQTIGSTISRVARLVDAASTYEVETPACVAAVRGSVMLVDVIEDGTTWVTNQEGNICVTAQGVTKCIGKGRKYIIIPGYPPRFVASSGPTGGGGGGGGGEGPRSSIALEKTPSATQVHDNEIITYTYVVTNTGDLALSNVTVADDDVGYVYYQSGDENENGLLDVDEAWVYTATYYVSQYDDSPLVNEAIASGVDTQSRTVTARATASVAILRPAIAIDKAGELVWNEEGFYSSIEYTYTITNSGNTPLYYISVIDDKIQEQEGEVTYQSGDDDEDEILDLDETWIFTATYWLSGKYGEVITNTATAYGTDALGLEVTAEATASVDILQPAIAIEKTGALFYDYELYQYYISYNYTVRNPGSTPLSDISVIDGIIGEATYQSGDTNDNGLLDTDETWMFTAMYYPGSEDGEYVTNSATAYGTDPLCHTVSAWDDCSIPNPYYYYDGY